MVRSLPPPSGHPDRPGRARPLLRDFLLPLVTGGPVTVGRPISPRELSALRAGAAVREPEPAARLASARQKVMRRFLPAAGPPAIDAAALAIGAAWHNLLLLNHPDLTGAEQVASRARIARMSCDMLDDLAPRDETDLVARHSLVARADELVQTELTVHYWLGERRFVGRPPPPSLVLLPRWRRVSIESAHKSWRRDVGVPAEGRALWSALQNVSPLGEALDPLRLDPPVSWPRLLPVLKYPSLARRVAERALEVGAAAAAEALAAALFRWASVPSPRESGESEWPPSRGRAGEPAGFAFAVAFIAHLLWLERILPSRGGPAAVAPEGPHLAALLGAAAAHPALLHPADVPADHPVTQALVASARAADARLSPAHAPLRAAAAELVARAVVGARSGGEFATVARLEPAAPR